MPDNLHVTLLIGFISLSKGKAKWKIRPDFFGGSLQGYFTNLVAHKPAFLPHLWGKQNYQAFSCSDPGQNLCHFLPYFTYNSGVFYRMI